MKRVIKRIGVLILSLILLLAVFSVTIYLFRERIIRAAVTQINKSLDTPVKVDKISLDAIRNFPQLTLKFRKVEIDESRNITGLPLCKAGNIEISFRLFDIISGNYKIQTLIIDDAVLNLAIDSAGNTNYHFLKKTRENSSQKSSQPLTLNIKKVDLKNVSFNFISYSNLNSIILHTPGLQSRLRYSDNMISANVSGVVNSEKIFINGISYLAGETTEIKSDFGYDLENDIVNFKNSTLDINGFSYLLNGMIGTTDDQKIDLSIQSSQSDIKALTSLLPETYREYLKDYQSKGGIEFRGTVKGALNTQKNPLVNFDFNCKDVSLIHPRINKTLNHISFSGKFTNGSHQNFETSVLEIKNLKGDLNNKSISGDLRINNLNRINIDMDLTADLDLGTVLVLFPVKNIKSGGGNISLNVKISGPLKSAPGSSIEKQGNSILASGDLTLDNASLLTYYSESSLLNLNGVFHFNNEDLAIESFSGKIGSSDFLISGFFKNILPFLLLPDQPILIEADFQSGFLNLNELLKINFEYGDEAAVNTGYHLDISPKLDVKLNCRARQVVLRKFSARNITGLVTIKDQRIIVDEARMNSMGGKLTLSGSISARHQSDREILADGHLEGIHIDSVFYVFNNFNQNFLVSRHLKGEIFADINTFLSLDNNLKFRPETLMSFINVSIVNGELNNFEPMQNLSKYIDSEALKHLKFSELRNDIQIKNQVITIPQMEIISNVSTIKVSGTHTFDQRIDYHFMVPLSQFTKDDPDSRFGEVEDSGTGMNVFLKMTGTTDDYRVSYDTKAMKNKVVQDFREEGKELREIFRKKENKTEKKVELEDNEYFDQ